MSHRHRILVFPCGSEVALEIKKSVDYSSHFELIGASSVDDHGRFAYENYIGGLPFYNSPDFLEALKKIVKKYSIDAIYPAMDSVAKKLQDLSQELDCKIIGSDQFATSICASKRASYKLIEAQIPTPIEYYSLREAKFPIFLKPDEGYGSRDCKKIQNLDEAKRFLKEKNKDFLIQEFLPGKEWTIDCFSNRHGELLFSGIRERKRINNGISVRTVPTEENKEVFEIWAKKINQLLQPRGAWFFQAKCNDREEPRLMEIAARPGGSSSLFRCQGINLPLMSLFDAFDIDVEVIKNNYFLELDRALSNKYKIELKFENIYVDLDDCIIINGKVNFYLIALLHKLINQKKKIILITRHSKDPEQTLISFRIREIFDEIIHLKNGERKSSYINSEESIFIDDSFAERKDVSEIKKIPTFSPDMVEALL